MPPPTLPLDGSEWALLRERVATVQALVIKRYAAGQFDHTLADLAPLQRLLDDNVFDETQVEELGAIGVAFGNVVAKLLGFEWVAVEAGRGRQPALRLKPTGALVIYPMRQIVDRITAGQGVNLTRLLQDIKAQAASTKLI
jgi:hypothetical protein